MRKQWPGTTNTPSKKQEKEDDPFKNLDLEPSVKSILLSMSYNSSNNAVKNNTAENRLAKLDQNTRLTIETDLASNNKQSLVFLDPNVYSIIVSNLTFQQAARLSLTCFTLWNRHRSHPNILLAKLTKEARKDPMVRHLLDAILFDPTYRQYPLNFTHVLHVLNRARPILNAMLKSDPQSAWKIFSLCCAQKVVDEQLGDEMPNIFDTDDRGVMHYITLGGDEPHFEWFFKGFDSFDHETADPGSRLARFAALGGSVPLLVRLRDKFHYNLTEVFEAVSIEFDDETLLTFAVMGGHKPTYTFLLNEGADPNVGRNLALTAAHYGHWEFYDELALLKDPTEEVRDAIPLSLSAARCGNLKLLLSLMAKHRLMPHDRIQSVIVGGHPEIFWHFISEKWLSLDETFAHGVTLAHCLAEAGHIDLLESVLNNNDKQAQPSDSGESILHFACRGGHRHIFDYLVKRYFLGQPLPIDNAGNTIAHTAAKSGQAFLLRYLQIICPEILTHKNNNDSTILHEAAHSGEPQLLRMIIEKFGIPIDSVDKEGNTVLHVLATLGVSQPQYWISIAAMIEIYGADLLDIPNKSAQSFTVREKIAECNAEIYFPEDLLLNESRLEY